MFRNFIRTFCSRCNSFKCFHCLDNNIISINSRFLKSPSGTKVSKFNFKHLLHSKFCCSCCVEGSILRCVFVLIIMCVWWGPLRSFQGCTVAKPVHVKPRCPPARTSTFSTAVSTMIPAVSSLSESPRQLQSVN